MSDIRSAWKLDTTDKLIQRSLMHEFPLPAGQEFVWQHFGQSWQRRHIRANGAEKTLCYAGVISMRYRSHEWSLEPVPPCKVDDCPDCRAMSSHYARKGYPHVLSAWVAYPKGYVMPEHVSTIYWHCEKCQQSGSVEYKEHADVYEVVYLVDDAHRAASGDCTNGVELIKVSFVQLPLPIAREEAV